MVQPGSNNIVRSFNPSETVTSQDALVSKKLKQLTTVTHRLGVLLSGQMNSAEIRSLGLALETCTINNYYVRCCTGDSLSPAKDGHRVETSDSNDSMGAVVWARTPAHKLQPITVCIIPQRLGTERSTPGRFGGARIWLDSLISNYPLAALHLTLSNSSM